MIDANELDQHIAARANLPWPVTVFAGAGVSADAGLPGWDHLIDTVIEDLATRLREAPEPAGYLSLQRELARQLKHVAEATRWLGPGTTWFVDTEERAQLASVLALRLARTQLATGRLALLTPVRDDFIRSAVVGALGHQIAPGAFAMALGTRLAAASALKLVVTTNWDNLIEVATGNAQTALPNALTLVPAIAALIQADSKPVVHLHGVLDPQAGGWPSTQPLVFSRADFLEFAVQANARPWQDEVVDVCFANSTCLFVGTSMTDLNYQRWTYHRSRRRYAHPGRPVEHIAGTQDPQCVLVLSNNSYLGRGAAERRQVVANMWADWRVRTLFLEQDAIVQLINSIA